MFNKHNLLVGVSILGSLLNVSGQKKASNSKLLVKDKQVKPRNIVFILTDDHRADFMGFTGKVSIPSKRGGVNYFIFEHDNLHLFIGDR